MADVRINGRRYPSLQSIDSVQVLYQRLELIAQESASEITGLLLDGKDIDLENIVRYKISLHAEDKVEVHMETVQQMSFECLQVAQEIAELLVFDIKVATLNVWDGTSQQLKTLETLLQDSEKFLLLAARPLELMNADSSKLPAAAKQCLRQLDEVAQHLEDTALLAVTGNNKESCAVMLQRLLPSIERWLGLSGVFAEQLQINKINKIDNFDVGLNTATK
jgi:hypothetical protein